MPNARLRVQRIEDEALAAKAGGNEPPGPATHGPPAIGTAPGPEAQKSALDKIRDIVDNNTWVGPLDELELGRLWSSFGEGLPQAYDANQGLWQKSRDRGMDLQDVGTLNLSRTHLGIDVRAIAGEYLERNLKDAQNAQKELGFDKEGTAPTEDQVEKRKDLEWAGVQLQELKKVKGRLETQWVGYIEIPSRFNPKEGEDYGGIYPVRFSPSGPPPIKHDDPRGQSAAVQETVVPWDDVIAQWKPVMGALLALADEHPVLFAALREDKLGQISGEDPGDDPAGSMKTIMATLIESIGATKKNLGSGSLDWRELKPIHRQLLEGERKVKIPWDHPVFKETAKEVVGSYETAKTVGDVAIGVAAAIMFIFAEAATGGAATALLLGGLGIGAANTASKWKSWDELKDASKAAASSKTELVGTEQADAAFIEAILETAFMALDVWQAGKAGLKQAAGAAAKQAGARAAATEGVEELAKAAAKGAVPDAAGKALVERSIVEQGVEATMKRMGIEDPLKLANLVPAGSAAAARITEYTALIAKLGKDVDVPKVLGSIAKEAAERGAKEVDPIVALAIERYGPLKTLQMAGGWKNLASALGADSAAGKLLLGWRDAIYRDLKEFVQKEMKETVQETGTLGNFTNDLDMSFLGKDASAARSKALQYLAGRSGLPANAQMLDKLLYIGLFTDPRRLHMFDQFPELASDLAKKTASFEEQLIWNAELQRVGKNAARRQRIVDSMAELGVKEIPEFKPLAERAVDVLSANQDRLVGEIELLAKQVPPDKGALGARMLELAEVQAQINVKEGGGYFSGGAVRRFVTEDPKNPFPGYKPGEAPAKPSTFDHQAALDQVNKLRKANDELAAAAVKGPEGLADVAGSIKSIAKYGDRFVEAAKAVGIPLPNPKVFDAMAGEFKRILDLARRETGETLQAALKKDFDKLLGEVGGAVSQFDAIHTAVLKDLRTQAGILGRDAVAADIVKATLTRYKWLRFKSVLELEMGSLGRLLSEGAKPSPEPVEPPAGVGRSVERQQPEDRATRSRKEHAPAARTTGMPATQPASSNGSSPDLQRGIVPGFLRSDKGTKEEIAAAIKSEDPADIKAIDDFSNADSQQKAQLIQILLNKTNLWAFDKRAMARIWNSFGNLEQLSVEQVALLRTCIERGFDHKDLKGYPFIAGDFRDSVKTQVMENLGENIKLIQKEGERLGLTGDTPKEGEKYDEQMRELQDLAAQIKDAKRMLYRSRKIVVAYTGALEGLRTGDKSQPLGGKPITFNPDQEPKSPEAEPVTNVNQARHEMPWRNVYPAYSAFTETIASILAQNPSLYVLETLGEPMQGGPTKPGQDPSLVYGDQARITGFENLDVKQAREKVRKSLLDVYNNARFTLANVMGGKMSPLQFDLVVSRHKQGAHGPKWSSPYAKLVAEQLVAADKSSFDTTMEMIGIVLILGAVAVGTGGAAAPLLGAILAGADVASAAAAAAYKTYEAENIQQAASSAASAKTAVTSQQQADRASLDAQMYQFMAIASIAGEALGALMTVGRAGGNLGAIDLVSNQAEKATMVVEALESMEVGQVALRTGKSPEDLAKIVSARASADVRAKNAFDKINEFIGRIAKPFGAARAAGTLDNLGGLERKAAAELIEKSVIADGIETTLTKTKKTPKELLTMVGEQSSIAGRLKAFMAIPEELTKLSSEKLAGRLQVLASEARLSATKAKAVVQLSVERLGPLETLRKGGGWDAIAKALGEERSAMQGLVHWRDTAMADLYDHLTQLGGAGTTKDVQEFLVRRFGGAAEELGIAGSKPLIRGTGTKEIEELLLRVADDKALANAGLMGASTLRKMAEEGHALRDTWKTLDAEARGKKLLELANARLKEVGVPPMKSFSFTAESDGLFLRSRWSFHLRESILANEAKFDWLLEAAYHEARHAEQAYQVARVKAKEMSVDLMEQGVARKGLGINREVAELAHKNPISPATAEGRQALRWYESMMGTGTDARQAAYAAMDEAEDELKRQTAFYLRSKEVTPALAPHAKEFVDRAWVDFENAVNRYKALPEEADAYAVQARFKRELEIYKNLVADEALPPTVPNRKRP